MEAGRPLTLNLFTEPQEKYAAALQHARGLRNEMRVVCYLVAAEVEGSITPQQAVAIWRTVTSEASR